MAAACGVRSLTSWGWSRRPLGRMASSLPGAVRVPRVPVRVTFGSRRDELGDAASSAIEGRLVVTRTAS